jgi:porphobilinogen synthase
MSFPIHRPRRLRRNETLRKMVRETTLAPSNFIAPIFVCEGTKVRAQISSMPGVDRVSVDYAVEDAKALRDAGVHGVLLFGVPSSKKKDVTGKEAWSDQGLVQKTSRAIKEAVPELVIFADTCFCEYTSHGHCGILDAHTCVHNDKTLANLGKVAVSQAKAGADFISPSCMLDGMVTTIRTALDKAGFDQTGILAYSAKYASAFYGPFRDAADSTPSFGDRRQYQMDCHNAREAIKETLLDIEEGADLVMVKPALSYMDIIKEVRSAVKVPVVVYNVSGEYSMVKAAAQKGWIDEKRTVLEITTSFKRAGADLIITYWAKELAQWTK